MLERSTGEIRCKYLPPETFDEQPAEFTSVQLDHNCFFSHSMISLSLIHSTLRVHYKRRLANTKGCILAGLQVDERERTEEKQATPEMSEKMFLCN